MQEIAIILTLMHAYLIVGKNEDAIETKVKSIAKDQGASLLEFPISKISDTRELGKFLKLSVNKKTAILARDIDNATTAALSAFLKNLEEPQENVLYILTAKSEYLILPTIVSRCQLIRMEPHKIKVGKKLAKQFLSLSEADRLLEMSKITKRDDAISFMQEFLSSLHRLMIEDKSPMHLAKTMSQGQKTLKAVNANGNVTLQLANFAINI